MYYFNTSVTVAVTDKALTEQVKNQIKSFLSETESTLSVTDKNSDVYRINSAEAGYPVAASETTANLFGLCKDYYERTGGKFNAGSLPLSKLWGLSADTYNKVIIKEEPTDEKIAETKALCEDFEGNFIYNDGFITKTQTGSALDFGGIAKGYSVDGIKNILSANGYKKGYINIGGSSLYILSVDENLSVKHPRKKGEYIISVSNDIINILFFIK